MSTPIAYTADSIFTGHQWLADHAVIVNDGVIEEIAELSSLPTSIDVIGHPGRFIAPAFIDLQIYGAHGKLFSVFPEAASLSRLNDYCRSGGAAFCMPTVATNTLDVFHKCIDAVRDYWSKGGEGVLGLHVEGPWINPVKRGAHLESIIHAPSVQEVRDLLEYGKGVIRIITLAPEICSAEVLKVIQNAGVIVSAGHSNASFEEAMQAFDNGIHAVTHLYNAMSPLQHRAPGLVGAAFTHEKVRASIIPDGHHVDFAAIRIAKKIMQERLFVITDAVTTTTDGPYPHQLAGDKYEANGILSGSALRMNQAVRNLVKEVDIDPAEALRMCSTYPARVLGVDGITGTIEPGAVAKLAVLDQQFELVRLIG